MSVLSKSTFSKLLSAAIVAGGFATGFAGAAGAQDAHRHVIEVHRGYPRGYVRGHFERERFYRGIPVMRHFGPVYGGFGFFYDDAAAWAFLGFTAWEMSIYRQLDEEQMRAHEAAIVEASTAPINEPVVWNDGPASGTVTVTRDGHTQDGRPCREFQQQVNIGGQNEQAYGTACRQPDGSWQIVKQ